ncbi:hypothetical protein SDC9_204015 [bioreactor metagenome]|uniref:Uncharacterized protein n=1 Tax=bioreactor metagenome TaxID=1076179 RepID=A0A645IYT3_9ZZZZ
MQDQCRAERLEIVAAGFGRARQLVAVVAGRFRDRLRWRFHPFAELAVKFARLFGAVADHHAADARVAMHDACLAEVVEDVVEHRADEARVRV